MKEKAKLLFLLALLLPIYALGQGELSKVWLSDQGDRTYKNPILHADYSDPDVVRVGENYYMTSSSFNCVPGLPILHSKDLVNWELIGHALKNLTPSEVFNKPQHGNGVWAPCIRFHNVKFYVKVVKCTDARTGGKEEELFSEEVENSEIYFKVKVNKGAECNFSFSIDGKKFENAGVAFEAKPGRWIGAKVGYFALREGITNDSGTVDIDWFRVGK